MGCQQSKLKKKTGAERTTASTQVQPQAQVRATPATLPAAKPVESPSVTCPQQQPATAKREHSPAVVPQAEVLSFVPSALCPSLQARRSRSNSSAASSLGECIDYTQGNTVEAMVRYWRRKLDSEKARREASVEAFVAVAVFEALVRQQDSCSSVDASDDDEEDLKSESHLGEGLAEFFALADEAALQAEEDEHQATESAVGCVCVDSLEATPASLRGLQVSSFSLNQREGGISAPTVGLAGDDVNSISSPRSLKSSLRLQKGVSSSDQENLPSPSSTVRNALRQPLCGLAADYVALYEDNRAGCSAAATHNISHRQVLQEQMLATRKVVFDKDTMRHSAPSGKHSQKKHSTISSKQQKHTSSGRKGPVSSRNTGAISNIRSDVYLEMANAFERMLTNVETIDAHLDTR